MDRARIAGLAREAGLGEIAETLADLALPGLLLMVPPDRTLAGVNRAGGRPLLPVGMSWPIVPDGRSQAGAPMCFIAQVDLSEVPDWLIPGVGLLSIWCDGVEPMEDGAAKVFVHSPAEELVEHDEPADLPSESRREGGSVEIVPWISLPGFGISPATVLDAVGFDESTADEATAERYWDLLKRLGEEQYRATPTAAAWAARPAAEKARGDPLTGFWLADPGERLGGHAVPVQNDPLIEAVESELRAQGAVRPDYQRMAALSRDWRLLFESAGEWFDGGSLYFCVPAEDLQHARFDRVQVVMQCC
jgi:uncharacterized protein YwqG